VAQGLTTTEIASTIEIDERTVLSFVLLAERQTACSTRQGLNDWYGHNCLS
jgi:hypothetical protein